ncbi:response regulator transcription factor [Clostridium sp. PL3]|uniref:Response regulator transcription factor n=1 Tax=Clostridium thailandense TaxID=2794346 RepID=A0A949TXU3_9CLOT|nr:LytTR family DNA-binding domain-containing protein [Clostridium thailandense]MBV7274553.1 response regulator transcription factor [Clostridium thailandense]
MELKFIICDDEKNSLCSTINRIERIIKEDNVKGEIVLCVNNPNAVLEYSKTNYRDANVYILDINFNNDINGLNLARTIRNNEPNSYIIFLTAHAQLSMLTFQYRLKVFDFLIKPVIYGDFKECINALWQDFNKIEELKSKGESDYINIKSGYREYKLASDEIFFIESFGPKLIIHMREGNIETYSTLKEFITTLNKKSNSFYKCHKSYIVNLNYITQLDSQNNELILSNGDRCLIGRVQKSYLREKMNI